jgi:hypothetical protein
MNDLNAFLMPFSFLRRWSYNELIPALLYFDRVTFLMDDIEPQYISDTYQQPGTPSVQLRSPQELADRNANEFVDGLTVEQHQYYWPMRDLMKEGIIAITSADMAPFQLPEHRQQLQTLLDEKNKLALEYETSARLLYDAYMPTERHDLSNFDKAMEVRQWIHHTLLVLLNPKRRGWQQVTLHPYGYRAFLSALDVFPDLLQLSIGGGVDESGRATQPPAQSYLTMRVVGTLLKENLNSFALEDDPNALSGILKVRQKYASDLQAFRTEMTEAANEWNLVDTDLRYMPGKVESYIEKVRPVFEHTRRALSDKLRIPKLIFREGGALILIGAGAGIGAAIGTALAGPPGTVAGATAGGGIGAAAPEAFKSFFEELGKEAADKVKPKDVSIDKSLVYLFHAQKALRQ